jgi:exosortase
MCYASTLRGMAEQWWNDEDMGHGFVVPFVIVWIVVRERERWIEVPSRSSWWGLPILVLGAAMQIAAELGAGLFAGSIGFLISVAGAIIGLGGFGRFRSFGFPMMVALFMLPKLAFAYNQATLPLQLAASRLAAAMISASGVGVIREGNILDVGGHRVLVAEACNGVRYLLSIGFMGVMVAYLANSGPGMRIAMFSMAVPLAIVANAVRVAASASVPALDSGRFHSAAGFVIFAASLAVLVWMRTLFSRIAARCHE